MSCARTLAVNIISFVFGNRNLMVQRGAHIHIKLVIYLNVII